MSITKGEWDYCEGNIGVPHELFVVDDKGQTIPIALFYNVMGVDMVANANLLVKAPEMLELLKDIVVLAYKNRGKIDKVYIEEIQNLIAEAEGVNNVQS